MCQYKNGLIIESLDSDFLRRPKLVLNYLLKGIGNIQYIPCIIFSQTHNDCIKYTEIEKREEEEKIAEMKKAKAEAIMEMDVADFENLTDEGKTFFKQEVLIPRKLNMLRKREQLKLRLEELKKKKQKPSKKDADMAKRLSLDRKKTLKSAKGSKGSKQSKPKASKSNKASKTSKKSSKASKKSSSSSKNRPAMITLNIPKSKSRRKKKKLKGES